MTQLSYKKNKALKKKEYKLQKIFCMKKTSEKITDQESVRHLRQRFHCSLAGASVDAHSTSLAYKSVIVTALTSQFMHTNPFLPLISILYFVKKTRTVKKKISTTCVMSFPQKYANL